MGEKKRNRRPPPSGADLARLRDRAGHMASRLFMADGGTKYEPLRPCAKGHRARYVSNGACVECTADRKLAYAQKDKDASPEECADPERAKRGVRRAPVGRHGATIIQHVTMAANPRYRARARSVLRAVSGEGDSDPSGHGEPQRQRGKASP